LAEILFYHLQRQPLEAVLPVLLQKSVERGWRALVRATSPERVSALDDHLWTFADDSFLAHGTDREPDAAVHPILLTTAEANPNGASVLFLVEGARLPTDVSEFERVVLLFDGGDPEALAQARADWRVAKAGAHAATYWQQDPSGRWEKKA
jgi:DNA polymerase III subunit chi